MTSGVLAALRSHALTTLGEDRPWFADYVAAYFEGADPEEFQTRAPSTLVAWANAHVRLLDQPEDAPGLRVRVFNPTLAEDGFISEHTLVQLVQLDRPFLVDSVLMSINRGGRTAHWLIHPVMAIDSRPDGLHLRQARARSPVVCAETFSFIAVACDRTVSESDMQALKADLIRSLMDVHAATADWAAMLQRLQDSMHQLVHHSTDGPDRAETLAYLQWLQQQHFTFLAARDYTLARAGGKLCLTAVPETGLGLMRSSAQAVGEPLPTEIFERDALLWVTKSLQRSTVHRPAWLDGLSLKRFDEQGQWVGETRFLGLYTSRAYASPVQDIPLVRQRVAAVTQAFGVVEDSHAAKSLHAILEAYPKDELFQVDVQTLQAHAQAILRLQERQRTRVLIRRDPLGRYISALVYLPRERYNTELRMRIERVLLQDLEGEAVEHTPMLTDDPMARIHFRIRVVQLASALPEQRVLEDRIAALVRRWQDDCQRALIQAHGEQRGLALSRRFAEAFPGAYQGTFSAAVGADDAAVLTGLTQDQDIAVRLYRSLQGTADSIRFKILARSKVALSDALPLLEHMGVRVMDEQAFTLSVSDPQSTYWIHDLGLQWPGEVVFAAVQHRFEALFRQAWCKQVESDDLNRLVLGGRLDARSISILRAYARYFRQIGLAYSPRYIETILCRNAVIAQSLIDLFVARFDPDLQEPRQALQDEVSQSIERLLRDVLSLDDDRVLRQFHQAILATWRTNAWQQGPDGDKPVLSFKFNSHAMPGLPEPRPMTEVWVYSPRVEAIHLRQGKVARGGIRWSDRPEDFRTEVLGLVKAQHVKNTVIVPVGSKGGFVVKRGVPASDREGWLREGLDCYRLFLSGLLDVTDNLVHGQVRPPNRVVRHDADDPYLVVAADKGTASFSDVANELAAQYGFWLGDAFASGGSQGYDHKKMGITARGAWVSAQRHFSALGHDIQRQPFTVVGIGDMSGDVFGNGMLLSDQIRLVAAFDHRHIFLDPDPDPAASVRERRRLFGLPRSGWDDYDRALITPGGGVYPRSAKSLPLSAPVRQRLGLDAQALSPQELLQAILRAPVDLLYNGGIGTYIKASWETHAQAGDKADDAVRVDACELRCKALVEGGNLGCTQNGRIEYASRGGRIYTDAIDNSGGVDCSDHEVNIKILLGRCVESGDLTLKQRNELLVQMTPDVVALVLRDNQRQTRALDVAAHHPRDLLNGQQQLMRWLEGAGRLHRAIEFLPSDEEIAHRRAQQRGLTAPEGAVLLAYAKISVFDDLLASDLPEDPFFERALKAYFPVALQTGFAQAMAAHPLRREIVATELANEVVNRLGATYVHFLSAEFSASTAEVVRATALAREVFDLDALWDAIDAMDGTPAGALQLDMLVSLQSLIQRASRWMLRLQQPGLDMAARIAHYQPGGRALRAHLAQWLPSATLQRWRRASQSLRDGGVDADLADSLSALEFVFPALDLVDLSAVTSVSLEEAARTYFELEHRLNLPQWQVQAKRLPTDTLWQSQARSSARDDMVALTSQITHTVLTRFGGVSDWYAQHQLTCERLDKLLRTIQGQTPDLAPLTVALRTFRQLV